MKLLITLCGLVLLASCSVDGDRFRGNAEAYSGYRPKDGKYFWVDSRAKCLVGQVEISGYRAVLEVTDGTKFRYRKACDTNSSAVTPNQVRVAFYGVAEGVRKEGTLAFLGGLFDRLDAPPDSVTSTQLVSSRALVQFQSGSATYDVLVRARGSIDNPTGGQGFILSPGDVLSEVAVMASTPSAEARVYTGRNFNLVEKFLGTQFLSAKFTGMAGEVPLDVTSTNGTDTSVSPPPAPESGATRSPAETLAAEQYIAGSNFSCGVWGQYDPLYCWGKNDEGQLGVGSTTEMGVPSKTGLMGVTRLSAGVNHACAIADRRIYCWGDNSLGQLGTSNPGVDMLVPKETSLLNATAVVAANYFSCAINNSRAFCWGNNTGGQLGLGTVAQANTPAAVIGIPEDVTAITAGSLHACAITVSKEVYCWGVNVLSQLGIGTSGGQYSTPQKINGLKLDTVSANSYTTCGVTPEGKVICWGQNQYGAASGDGVETSTIDAPREVTGLPASVGTVVSVGQQFACAVQAGDVYCWGSNFSGATGIGTTSGFTAVRRLTLPAGEKARGISCGSRFCLAKVPSGVTGWGSNSNGQLGNNSTLSTAVPIAITY